MMVLTRHMGSAIVTMNERRIPVFSFAMSRNLTSKYGYSLTCVVVTVSLIGGSMVGISVSYLENSVHGFVI